MIITIVVTVLLVLGIIGVIGFILGGGGLAIILGILVSPKCFMLMIAGVIGLILLKKLTN